MTLWIVIKKKDCLIASAECKRREIEDSPGNRRDILGNIMSSIRFTAMNVQDFADHVATSGMLSLQVNKVTISIVIPRRKGT